MIRWDTRKRELSVSLNRLCSEVVCILRFALLCILNSLSYECDGGVDCTFYILCRQIFEEAPLGGEVENRKVIRSC